jgi:tetratricopeptide (TPR) repeat protein
MEYFAEAVKRLPLRLLSACVAALLCSAAAVAGPFDEMPLERWSKLREAERYQLNIAEKYYREQKWKVAADEYEKFLKLYDRGEGASFAQLKWSHCQIQLRKQNTAIKDGYQSVIDYYPDSPEAPIAAYLIGKTYKDTGDIKAAKKALAKVLSSYPKQVVAVFARLDLVEVAAKEGDSAKRVVLLRELTYEVDRKGEAVAPCVQATHQLAQHYFTTGDFAEGLKALQTSHKEDVLPAQLMNQQFGRLPWILQELTGQADEAVKKRALKVADEAVAYLRAQVKSDLADAQRKPRGVACWYYIADVQRSARRADKEREVYEEILKTLGNDDQALGRLAFWYKTNGPRDQARATYLKFKDAAEGQRQIAVSWIEENKFDPAIEIFRKLALEHEGEAPKWLGQVAATYRRAGKPDQAIAVYRELLNRDVKNADAYNWEVAQTLFEAQRWKEALGVYRGTERFPQNYQQMAMCHRQLKQWDEAIALYVQIVAGHQQTASWAALQIAYTQEQADRKEAAIKAFKQVCDRYPKTQEGSTAHEHLNRVYKISVTLGGAKD